MKRVHSHKWEIEAYNVAGQTITVRWGCARKGCPYYTETSHTFRRPRATTVKTILRAKEYRELIGAQWSQELVDDLESEGN